MALIDTVPLTKAVLPSVVQGHANGKLPADLLRNFDGRGQLLKIVSYGMQALHLMALNDNVEGFGPIDTETVGRYRTFTQQYNLFFQRYTTTNTGRSSKVYNGVRYYLKPGMAMAAVPGTSNHGWGSADDVAEERTGDTTPDSMSDRQLRWMRDNAPSFGFGLEQRAERWHWHWIAGNTLPQRAVDVLRYCGVTIDLPGYEGVTVPVESGTPSSHGPDIHDSYQPVSDWSWMKNYPFASCKLSHGIGVRPGGITYFKKFREGAILYPGAMRYRGLYHWLLPTSSMRQQADVVLHAINNSLDGLKRGEFIEADWEPTPNLPLVTSDQCYEFCQYIEEEYPGRVMVYSSDWLPDSTLDEDSRAEFVEWQESHPEYPLRFANYKIDASSSGGWEECKRYGADAWQWSSTAVVPGIVTGCDMNHVFRWDTLDRICGYTTAEPPVVVPPVVVEPPVVVPPNFTNSPNMETENDMRVLILQDVRGERPRYRCSGNTKTWIQRGDESAQINYRLAECAGGTRPSPVDGFTYTALDHGGNDVIASYGPIVGPRHPSVDEYGRQ